MTATNPVTRGQRYKRVLIGLVVVGVASVFVGVEIEQPLAGLVVYGITVFGVVGLCLYAQFSDSVTFLDERDRRLHERASHTAVTLFTYVGLPAFVAVMLLDEVGYYDIGPAISGAIYAFSAFYLTWGVVYLLFRYRT